MRTWILLPVAAAGLVCLGALVVHYRLFALGGPDATSAPEDGRPQRVRIADVSPAGAWDVLPRYVDLDVGDLLRVVRTDGSTVDVRVRTVEVDSRSRACPRTRVGLVVDGQAVSLYCGMAHPKRGGIEPVAVAGLKIGVEVTRLLYSGTKRGRSNYNAYRHFRLQGDVRLVVWDTEAGILRGTAGSFILEQPAWARERFGNWLHSTSYGLHAAIDVFATTHGVPEPVLSPVDGVVHRVYHTRVDANDPSRAKTILIYSDLAAGPDGRKVLFRLMHLSEILVEPGEHVRAGQVIGRSGHTGFDPRIGDHVHFEMRIDPSYFGHEPLNTFIATVPINPYPYLLEWWASTPRTEPSADRSE
jgi:murein DD-endopeptidase MepM/ murein hydrolase activator NlpD